MAIYTPFPIDGTVYDTDGSTVRPNAIVVILYTTTEERLSTTTDDNGQFILDISNFTSGYSNNDKLQITATYGSESGIRSISRRYTVNVGAGSYSIGNMILHEGEESLTTCSITFVSLTNSTSGGLYTDFYDRNDNLVFRMECGAGLSIAFPIGYLGLKMDKGFIRVFESETSGSLKSMAVVK